MWQLPSHEIHTAKFHGCVMAISAQDRSAAGSGPATGPEPAGNGRAATTGPGMDPSKRQAAAGGRWGGKSPTLITGARASSQRPGYRPVDRTRRARGRLGPGADCRIGRFTVHITSTVHSRPGREPAGRAAGGGGGERVCDSLPRLPAWNATWVYTSRFDAQYIDVTQNNCGL